MASFDELDAFAVEGKGTIDAEPSGKDLFLRLDGVRIAKRGRPGSRKAGKWIPLMPGYEIVDNDDITEIIISVNGVRLQ